MAAISLNSQIKSYKTEFV